PPPRRGETPPRRTRGAAGGRGWAPPVLPLGAARERAAPRRPRPPGAGRPSPLPKGETSAVGVGFSYQLPRVKRMLNVRVDATGFPQRRAGSKTISLAAA